MRTKETDKQNEEKEEEEEEEEEMERRDEKRTRWGVHNCRSFIDGVQDDGPFFLFHLDKIRENSYYVAPGFHWPPWMKFGDPKLGKKTRLKSATPAIGRSKTSETLFTRPRLAENPEKKTMKTRYS